MKKKVETIEEFKARGGKIKKLKPSPKITVQFTTFRYTIRMVYLEAV